MSDQASTRASYTAYSYLAPGELRQFELAPEFGRVPPYKADLTDAQRERSRQLLADSLVISLHDHPVRFPAQMSQTPSTTAPAGSTRATRAWSAQA